MNGSFRSRYLDGYRSGYASGYPPSGSAAPSPDATGLVAWFKADAGVTFGTGSKVSAWADQSGNGRDVTQATGANQPTLTAGVLNGLPGVTFSGASQVMSNTLSNLVASGAARHVFMLVKAGAAGGTALAFKSGTPNFACLLFSSLPNVFVYSDSVAISTTISTPPSIAGQGYELEYASTGAGPGSLTFALNATDQALSRTDTNADTGATGFLVGNNGLGTYFDGSVVEILAYDRVKTGIALATNRAYLQYRSGIVLT